MSIEVEPTKIYKDEELPAIGIYITEDVPVDRTQTDDSDMKIVERDGEFFSESSTCCKEVVLARQFFLVEIVHNQCVNVHAKVGYISEMMEQCLACLCEDWHYDGYTTIRPQDPENSTKHYTRQYRYYHEHRINRKSIGN